QIHGSQSNSNVSGVKTGDKSKSSHKRLLDSQDDLFNDSLELDLCPLNEKKKSKKDYVRKKNVSEIETVGATNKAVKKNNELNKDIIEIDSEDSLDNSINEKSWKNRNKNSNVSQTQNSIFDELF
ncbi:unnamed protein product, partial [Meganyctiphanes norvegica]